jgi:16S rRNA (guanine527-N7)-methyltransferase
VTARTEYLALLAPHCSGEVRERLTIYGELLERWSAKHNLVRFADRRELVDRHIVDALAGTDHMAKAGRLLDIGSGAGLPGVPLLAACPGWSGVLLEPRQKRWAFLKLVIRELSLAAEAVRSRYEDFHHHGPWDLVTTRAVGGHEMVLAWARGRLSGDGSVYLWTTAEAEATLQRLSGWSVLSSPLPGLERGRLARLQPCFT